MTGRLIVAIVAGIALSGCSTDSPRGGGPTTPSALNLAGSWSGTTFQGQPLSFTVSPGLKVTAVSIGYVFPGCSGVDVFSDLDVPIVVSPAVAFGHSRSLPDGRAVSLQVFFMSDRMAVGGVVFYGPSNCGSTGSGGNMHVISKQ